MRTAGRSLAPAVALLIGAIACGNGDGSATGATTPSTTSTSAVDTRSAEEQAVIDAYLAFWDALAQAHDPPNPDHPALTRTATGDQLSQTKRVLREDAADQVAVRAGAGPIQHNPSIVEMSQERATIFDCWLDTDVAVSLETSEVIDNSETVFFGEFALVLEDGWKVTASDIQSASEGQTCDDIA